MVVLFADKGISGTPQRLECSSVRQIDKWLLLPSVKTANVSNKPAGLIGVGPRR